MKSIIISDLHNRIFWVEDFLSSITEHDRYDNIIFLGDYFDDFGDSLEDTINSAKWLKTSLKKPNRIHLFGTHDLWYRFPFNPFLEVSGNTQYKEKVINEILSETDWTKLKLFYYEQNFLITHAGIHPYLISEYVSKNREIFKQYITKKNLDLRMKQIIDKIIKPATDDALNEVAIGHDNSWLSAGFARGGFNRVGGITWLDWIVEFIPIPGINQIVGHTELIYPEEKIIQGKEIISRNYNLDTKNHHIGIIQDGNLTWFENPYIKY